MDLLAGSRLGAQSRASNEAFLSPKSCQEREFWQGREHLLEVFMGENPGRADLWNEGGKKKFFFHSSGCCSSPSSGGALLTPSNLDFPSPALFLLGREFVKIIFLFHFFLVFLGKGGGSGLQEEFPLRKSCRRAVLTSPKIGENHHF